MDRETFESRTVSIEKALAVNTQATTELGHKIDAFINAFPEGDFEGHRRYHEEMIQQMEDRRKLRQEIIYHLAKSSTWAALVGLAVVLYNRFKGV